jgi:HEAT repeat protein
MSVDLAAGVVRVLKPNGETAGTGFVVSQDGLIVTCAHVLQSEETQRRGDPRPNYVNVVFLGTSGAYRTEVENKSWRPVYGDDVCIMRLVEPLPRDVKALKLGSTRQCGGHRMRTLGFPPLSGGYDVVWVEGELRGVVPNSSKQSMLQIDAHPIWRGMSGAPVFDIATCRVVGMVSEYLAEAPLKWATTSETLYNICPALPLHPPQAVEDYLTAVREYCINLPYLTLHEIRPPKTLDETYIPLKARPKPPRDENIGAIEERTVQGIQHLEPLSIAEVMQERDQPHVLILGEPGAGKSTLLRQLAEYAWDAPQKIGLEVPHLPILVPLRRLVSSDGSLEDRLSRALSGELALKQGLVGGFFANWPAQVDARWLILLDSLDEVPAAERARWVQWFKGILKSIRPHRVIITSRPSGYSLSEFDEKLFAHYDLLPFTPEQTSEFAQKWVGGRSKKFLDELERVRASELHGTPLLLTIAAKVFLEENKLPQRRSALYEQFVDIWLWEAEQRGLEAELGDRLCKVVKPALARIAQAMTERPHEVTESVLFNVAAAYLRDALHLSYEEARADSIKFIKVMAQRSGLFIRRVDMYDFIHPTFQEYLTACSWVDNWGTNTKKIHKAIEYHRVYLQDTVLFLLGILSDSGIPVTKPINRIIEQRENGLYFAADCIAEGIAIDDKTKSEIVKRLLAQSCSSRLSTSDAIVKLTKLRHNEEAIQGLLALIYRGKFPPLADREAIYALAKMGRIDDLLQIANNEQLALHLRIYAAEALIRVSRNTKVVSVLKAIVSDKKINSNTRCFAAGLIGEVGYTRVATNLLRSLARNKRIDASVRCNVATALAELGHRAEAVSILLSLVRKKKTRRGQETSLPSNRRLMEKYLFDRESSVRASAAFALGRLGRSDIAIPTLLALGNDREGDPLVRLSAVRALVNLDHGDDAVPILLALVHDQRIDDTMRFAASYQLIQLGSITDLLSLEENTASERIRYDVARALLATGHVYEAVRLHLSLIHGRHTSLLMRAFAFFQVWRLGQKQYLLSVAFGETTDEWMLAPEYRARNRDVDGIASNLLLLALDSQIHARVRRAAAEALENLGKFDKAIRAWQSLRHGGKSLLWVKCVAARALRRLGHKVGESSAYDHTRKDEQTGEPNVQ